MKHISHTNVSVQHCHSRQGTSVGLETVMCTQSHAAELRRKSWVMHPPLFPLDSPSLPSYEYSCWSNLEKLKLIAISPKIGRKEKKGKRKRG